MKTSLHHPPLPTHSPKEHTLFKRLLYWRMPLFSTFDLLWIIRALPDYFAFYCCSCFGLLSYFRSVQLSLLIDWVIGGTRGTIQQRPSSSLFCRKSLWAFWHGQICPLFRDVHPAFPLPTMVSPTLQTALEDGFRETVVTCNMPGPCKFPSLDICQKKFLWTHKEVDQIVSLVLQVGDTGEFLHALGFRLFFFFLLLCYLSFYLVCINWHALWTSSVPFDFLHFRKLNSFHYSLVSEQASKRKREREGRGSDRETDTPIQADTQIDRQVHRQALSSLDNAQSTVIIQGQNVVKNNFPNKPRTEQKSNKPTA